MTHWCTGALEHDTRFTEHGLALDITPAVAHFHYQMVTQQTAGFAAGCALTGKVEAAHDILVGELLWQA